MLGGVVGLLVDLVGSDQREVADEAVPPSPAPGGTASPFRESPAAPTPFVAAPGPRPPAPPLDASAVRLLVVDDNEINLRLVTELLASTGADVSDSPPAGGCSQTTQFDWSTTPNVPPPSTSTSSSTPALSMSLSATSSCNSRRG